MFALSLAACYLPVKRTAASLVAPATTAAAADRLSAQIRKVILAAGYQGNWSAQVDQPRPAEYIAQFRHPTSKLQLFVAYHERSHLSIQVYEDDKRHTARATAELRRLLAALQQSLASSKFTLQWDTYQDTIEIAPYAP